MQFVYRELRPYSDYYFAAEVVWITLVLAYCVSRPIGHRTTRETITSGNKLFFGKGRGSFRMMVVLASICVAVTSWFHFQPEPSPLWIQRLNLADDMKQLLPANQHQIGAVWSGALAQFSGKMIIPLDGLVGSNEFFQTYVKTGRQFDYLLEQPEAYLAVYLPVAPEYLSAKTLAHLHPWNLNVEKWLANGDISFKVLASRPLNSEGAGWYLLKIDAASQKAN